MKPFFFTENVPNENTLKLINKYETKDFYEVTEQSITFKICGFLTLNEHLICVFPKGLLCSVNYDENLLSAQLLLKVLLKYQKSAVKEQLTFSSSKKNNNAEYLNLINDIITNYNMNGLYRTNIKQKRINGNGKTNWNKTFKATSPVIVNNQFAYLDLINERNLTNLSSELAFFHFLILKNISTDFGWLFNFKLPHYNFPTENLHLNRAKFVLKKALNTTFNNNSLNTLKLLLRYVEMDYKNNSIKETNLKLLLAYKFDMVWEEVCKVIFEHQPNILNKVPRYIWTTVTGKSVRPLQKPDILSILDNSRLLIIDAKYYKPNDMSSSNILGLPGSADIGKQLLYRKSLLTNNIYTDLYNVFILPNSISKEQKYIELFGISSFENLYLQKEFDNIYAFQIDTLAAMQDYLMSKKTFKINLIDCMKEIL